MTTVIHALVPIATIGAAVAGLLTGHLTSTEFITVVAGAAGIGTAVVAVKG